MNTEKVFSDSDSDMAEETSSEDSNVHDELTDKRRRGKYATYANNDLEEAVRRSLSQF